VLLGEFSQRIDAKNRVTLPKRYRPQFADGVVVTKGLDGCLFVFDRAGFERFVDAQLARLDSFSRETRRLERYLYAGATETELDAQGRVMLTAPLIEHAGLGRDIVVAGLRDRLEIWDAEAWVRQDAEGGDIEDAVERLAR
jgi:MraZ protein